MKQQFDGWSLLKLVYALRSLGITVSTQEIQDAFKALAQYPDLPPYLVFRSLFIHRMEELETFSWVWQLLFAGIQDYQSGQASTESDHSSEQENSDSGWTDSSESGEGLHQGIGTGNFGISLCSGQDGAGNPVTETFQIPDIEQYFGQKGFPSVVDDVEDQEKFDFEAHVKFILGQSGFLSWANSLELARGRGRISEAEWRKFEEFKAAWEQEVRQKLWRHTVNSRNDWAFFRQVNWRFKSLDSFTPLEENMVHQALRQMGNKLAVRPGRRKKKGNHGKFCFSSLLKEKARGNGLIFHWQFERPVPQHPEFIILCDVSNSVAPFSQFFLYLLQRIKSRFRRIRLYLFVDTLWDITNQEWLKAGEFLEEIRSWGRRHSSGFSDYGQVFAEYTKSYLSEASAHATVLILGDGRNNFRPAQAECLKEVHEKVRRIYWLNPLTETEWLARDNVMSEYRPYCTQVFQCRTLDDLWQITREVF